MARYAVTLLNTASFYVEVEAEDEEEAFSLAFDLAPYENIHNEFELGDWYLPSDIIKGATDIERIGE